MPHIRISLLEGKPSTFLKTLSDTIQNTLVETIGVSAGDRFQIIDELKPSHLHVSSPLVGVEHSDDVIILHISLKAGRSLATKKHLYHHLATNLSTHLGIKKEDIIIMLVDLPAENWSFGSGMATLLLD